LAKITKQEQLVEPVLPKPKEIVAGITKAQAKAGTWLWPKDNLSVKGRFMAVVRDGIEPTLYVNGDPVPANQIGERMANRREKAQVVAWYGVALDAGENTVEIKGVGPFGNERILATGVFKKPSSGAMLKVSTQSDTIQADGGRSTLPVTVEVLDEHGYPALGVYFVTLESSDGGWLEEDMVKGKVNLTLSYDSDKNSEEILLRDINPSAHYPIHGDASIRGYEAQSRSKLYLKLERDKRSLMWGDYLTDSTDDHEDLARSRRTLTGFNAVIDDDKNRFRFFAAPQKDQRVSEEVAGNGSAMLYRLQSYPIVSNSEVVELITRSRDNPGIVVARTRLSRFGDYTIDPVFGYVTFSTSIPTLDDQQNPVFVQISYDVESGGDDYLVSGVRFDRNVSDNLRFGISHTTDDHSQDGKDLSGVYATYQLEKRTRVSASAAVSDSLQSGAGSAARISIDHH